MSESKSDQFQIDEFYMPYRVERNCNGGGVLIYVCEDIPSKLLKMHKVRDDAQNFFIEHFCYK